LNKRFDVDFSQVKKNCIKAFGGLVLATLARTPLCQPLAPLTRENIKKQKYNGYDLILLAYEV